MAVSFSQLFRGMCGGSFGGWGVKGFAAYTEEDQAFIFDVVLYRVPPPLLSASVSKLSLYIVRPARMRSSFPLLEPGPPRFFWWYENSE